MKMFKLYFTVMILLLAVSTAFAEPDPQKEKVIKKFVQALKVQDDEAISNSWLEINRNSETKEYLKVNHPKAYHAFEMRGIVDRLHALQAKYLNRSAIPEAVASSTPSREPSLSNVDALSNSRIQETNGDTARSYPNQSRTSNSDIAQSSPNQDRTSNQDLIRSRLRSR